MEEAAEPPADQSLAAGSNGRSHSSPAAMQGEDEA